MQIDVCLHKTKEMYTVNRQIS